MLKVVTVIIVSSINSRPMCEFTFELTSANLALRVSNQMEVNEW